MGTISPPPSLSTAGTQRTYPLHRKKEKKDSGACSRAWVTDAAPTPRTPRPSLGWPPSQRRLCSQRRPPSQRRPGPHPRAPRSADGPAGRSRDGGAEDLGARGGPGGRAPSRASSPAPPVRTCPRRRRSPLARPACARRPRRGPGRARRRFNGPGPGAPPARARARAPPPARCRGAPGREPSRLAAGAVPRRQPGARPPCLG